MKKYGEFSITLARCFAPWLALQRMGLRLKKSHSTRKSKSARKSRRGVSSGGKR